MAKVIEKIEKTYTGLGQYEIRIYLDTKNGLFTADVPAKSLNPGNLKVQSKELIITDTTHVWSDTYKGILAKIKEEQDRYERFELDFERIIMVNIEEKSSYMDGSGRGIVFNWGVFRKYKNPRNENYEFELESSNPNKKDISYQHLKQWKQIKYSKEAVDFLIQIDGNLDALIKNLIDLINSDNIEQKMLALTQ